MSNFHLISALSLTVQAACLLPDHWLFWQVAEDLTKLTAHLALALRGKKRRSHLQSVPQLLPDACWVGTSWVDEQRSQGGVWRIDIKGRWIYKCTHSFTHFHTIWSQLEVISVIAHSQHKLHILMYNNNAPQRLMHSAILKYSLLNIWEWMKQHKGATINMQQWRKKNL